MHWKPLPASHAGPDSSGVLYLAVPKRQLRRAVDRNLVRRIAREAWRAGGPARVPLALLIRLRRRPDDFASTGVRRRRKDLRAELDRLLTAPALMRVSDTLRRAGSAGSGPGAAATPRRSPQP